LPAFRFGGRLGFGRLPQPVPQRGMRIRGRLLVRLPKAFQGVDLDLADAFPSDVEVVPDPPQGLLFAGEEPEIAFQDLRVARREEAQEPPDPCGFGYFDDRG